MAHYANKYRVRRPAIAVPMSALPPKADICSALAYVRFGQEKNIRQVAG